MIDRNTASQINAGGKRLFRPLRRNGDLQSRSSERGDQVGQLRQAGSRLERSVRVVGLTQQAEGRLQLMERRGCGVREVIQQALRLAGIAVQQVRGVPAWAWASAM